MRTGWRLVIAALALLVIISGCGGGGGSSSSAVTVTFQTPTADNRTVTQGATVPLEVTVSAGSLVVDHVTFTCNGYAMTGGTVNSSPYQMDWNTSVVAPGTYTILATAYDNSTPAKTGTASISIKVNSTGVNVAFTSPVSGSSVTQGATVTCTVTASAPTGIQRVDFFANDTPIGTVSAPPYTVNWSTSGLATGAYTIVAKAYDNTSPTPLTGSASLTVNVQTATAQPPTVSITSPANGATVSFNVIVQFTATVHTTGATVSQVQVTMGGTTKTASITSGLATVSGSVTFDSTTMADGNYPITAKATDSNSRYGSSNITVAVANSTSPPPPPW